MVSTIVIEVFQLLCLQLLLIVLDRYCIGSIAVQQQPR